ncbi:MAG TPA: transposase [Rhodanobacteraceae bacterium]
MVAVVSFADAADHFLGLLQLAHVDTLRAVVGKVKRERPFAIDAWVVLPEHLHAVWTLPRGDADFSTRWMLIKAGFSRALPRLEEVSASRRRKGERGIWQRRFWEHQIRDERDFASHVDYVHINPVKHGYVAKAAAWPYSSIHRYIRHGVLPADWGCDPDACGQGGGFGEA